MKTTRQSGAIIALVSLGFIFGTACAPTPHAKSVAVTYYYMPG